MKNTNTTNDSARSTAVSMFGMTEATMRCEVRSFGGWHRYALSTLYAAASDLVRVEPCEEMARQRINRAKFAMVTAEEEGSVDADPFLSPLFKAQELISRGYTARAEMHLAEVALAYRRALAEHAA